MIGLLNIVLTVFLTMLSVIVVLFLLYVIFRIISYAIAKSWLQVMFIIKQEDKKNGGKDEKEDCKKIII